MRVVRFDRGTGRPTALNVRGLPALPVWRLRFAWLAMALAVVAALASRRVHAAASLVAVLYAGSLLLDEHPVARRRAAVMVGIVIAVEALSGWVGVPRS